MLRIVCQLLLVGLISLPSTAWGQQYPAKAIKLVVPFPAGGPATTIGRLFGEKLAALMGQPVVIENRGGVAGVTGIAQVAKADPDGYTIGLASAGALAVNVALNEKMPYDPLKDLLLMTQAVSVPELLVVSPSVPAKTYAELIAFAKATPGKLNYASTGPGGMPHMATELLKNAAQIDLAHVPYTGAAPAVNDLLGGHVQVLFADVPALLGSVQSGALRALAISSRNRVAILPDVPTTMELGLPQVEADNFYGIVAPAALPQAVAAKLTANAIAALQDAAVTERLAQQGIVVVGSTTGEFVTCVKSEITRWGQLAQAAGIKMK